MSELKMAHDGTICLPADVREKHGFTAETPIRIIETRSGILLIPLTPGPMTDELKSELADWQALSTATWDKYPYEDTP